MKTQQTNLEPLEGLWPALLSGDVSLAANLLTTDSASSWDDPIFDRRTGDLARTAAIRDLSDWSRDKAGDKPPPVAHLRTTRDERRVVVESVLSLRDGLIWNQAERRAEKADQFQLPVAVVGDRASGQPDKYSSIRIYFGTWSVLMGKPKVRVGPVAPDERAKTRDTIEAMPIMRRYFECLATGQPEIIDLFEPDGYFREPANNFACGLDQLTDHFSHILKLGGVGVEFLTAVRENATMVIELQTITWGSKKMDAPQAGFASYELGSHGKIIGSRVYDSVVPPEL